jgi:hypothetical protein
MCQSYLWYEWRFCKFSTHFRLNRKTMHQLNSTKRARVTSNAIHLPGSRILHYVRFRYPIGGIRGNLSGAPACIVCQRPNAMLKAPVPPFPRLRKLSSIEHSQYLDGWPLQTGEPYKGLHWFPQDGSGTRVARPKSWGREVRPLGYSLAVASCQAMLLLLLLLLLL